jgi:thymidylate synthase (FAD)
VLDPAQAAAVQDTVRANAARAYRDYLAMLNRDEAGAALEPDRAGLARELARIVLPLNTYTEWYWKTDLHNLLHFIALRADPHAQYEIRAYALALLDVVRRWVPLACAAFEDYRLDAAELSGKALAALRRMLAGEDVTQADSGLSAREWRELQAHLHGD